MLTPRKAFNSFNWLFPCLLFLIFCSEWIYNFLYDISRLSWILPWCTEHTKGYVNEIILSGFCITFDANILLQLTSGIKSTWYLIYEKFIPGYPYNLDFDYGALTQLQHFSINNLGDPFIESNYGVHSRQFEVGVLDWFARLWELEKNEYWGYITNCGTEGNLHGILVGLVSASPI